MKKKRYDIKNLSIYRVLNKEHFLLENHAENAHYRLFADLFLTLVNNPTMPLRARNSFKNEIV